MDYNTSTATNIQKRLSTGFLVKKIVEDSIAKAGGKEYKDTKIFLYSAHESNIAAILRFLGIFYSHIPPYGSYVIFEIHNIGGVRGIKVYYQDYTSERPKKYRIPGCGSLCSLEKFKSLYKHLLPTSEVECFM
ncbi:hypothetical protein JTB14_035865 [Gonioctena quinquepunctata]|nr:hypothetical protein JTB14_035865 [Gonioctena quinquepunctata]